MPLISGRMLAGLLTGIMSLVLPNAARADPSDAIRQSTALDLRLGLLPGTGWQSSAPSGSSPPIAGQGVPTNPVAVSVVASDPLIQLPERDDRGSSVATLPLGAQSDVSHSVTAVTSLLMPFGSIDVSGGMFDLTSSNLFDVDRMVSQIAVEQINRTALQARMVVHLSDRFTFGSSFAWANQELAFDEPLHGAQGSKPHQSERIGVAQWYDFDAKILNLPGLNWTVMGRLSSIGQDFAPPPGSLPKGEIALSGDRAYLATRLQIGGVTLSAADQRLSNRLRDLSIDRVTIAIGGGGQVSLYRREAAQFSFLDIDSWLSRTLTHGVSLEIYPKDWLSQNASSGLGSWAAVLPDLADLSDSQADVAHPLGDAIPRSHDATISANADWTTFAGETTATLWRRSSAAIDARRATSFDQFIDIWHTVSRGAWQFGVGLSIMESRSASANSITRDRDTLANFSLAYAPTDGPIFEARLGHDSDVSSLDDLGTTQQSGALDLSVSLDMSTYVQKQLNRRDTHLKLEYRRYLDQSAITAIAPQSVDKEALFVSFGTPL